MLIAAHPWDVDGAARARLLTGWVARSGGGYPPYFVAPDTEARDLERLVASLQDGS